VFGKFFFAELLTSYCSNGSLSVFVCSCYSRDQNSTGGSNG